MKTESIIFDLDGTLWDSSDNVAAAWNEAVRQFGVGGVIIKGETVRGVMGMTMDAIARRLFPMLSADRQTELMEKCTANEDDYLAVHGGRLFDGTTETLRQLRENHRLFIVSNCQCGYIETFCNTCGTGEFFTDHLCWGDTGVSKGETIGLLMEKHSITSAAYVGDTQGDLDSAVFAGIPFVHAAYGFGTISTPEKISASAKDIGELVNIFEAE